MRWNWTTIRIPKRICPHSPTAARFPTGRCLTSARWSAQTIFTVSGKVLAPLDNITRAEFAQIFHNIIGTYIVSKGTYDKDIKGSVLIRTDDVELKNLTVDGDLIIGCGAADGKITLDNVTVKGRLLVWGGGTKAVYCNDWDEYARCCRSPRRRCRKSHL